MSAILKRKKKLSKKFTALMKLQMLLPICFQKTEMEYYRWIMRHWTSKAKTLPAKKSWQKCTGFRYSRENSCVQTGINWFWTSQEDCYKNKGRIWSFRNECKWLEALQKCFGETSFNICQTPTKAHRKLMENKSVSIEEFLACRLIR